MVSVTGLGNRVSTDVREGDNFTNDHGEVSSLSPLMFGEVGRYALQGGSVMRPHAPVMGFMALRLSRDIPPIVRGDAANGDGARVELPPADHIG